MNDREIKVGIVGLGFLAQNAHIPTLIGIDGVNITALCDNNERILQKVGSLYNIESLYNDPFEMAEKSDCDCVFVLTKPDSTHPSIAIVMLENGKDVMCEKPMATNLSDAKKMIEVADKTSQILMVGFNRRFMPICIKAKEIFEGKKIGICKVTYNTNKPRKQWLLADLHPVDLLRFFCGEANAVSCISRFDDSNAEESITALIEFESGTVGILINNSLSGGKSENVEIHGEGYSIIIDLVSQTTRTMNNRDSWLFAASEWSEYRPSKWAGFHVNNGFTAEDKHFIESVKNRRQPLVTGLDAYKSHELVNKIYKVSGLPEL